LCIQAQKVGNLQCKKVLQNCVCHGHNFPSTCGDSSLQELYHYLFADEDQEQ
jgi:hypothetical protein